MDSLPSQIVHMPPRSSTQPSAISCSRMYRISSIWLRVAYRNCTSIYLLKSYAESTFTVQSCQQQISSTQRASAMLILLPSSSPTTVPLRVHPKAKRQLRGRPSHMPLLQSRTSWRLLLRVAAQLRQFRESLRELIASTDDS